MNARLCSDPFAEYLANEGYGSSDFSNFRKGPPALVPWRRANREGDTDATRVGSAAHCLILTPELFDATYALKPQGMTFASKEGKAWREERRQAGVQDDCILTWDATQLVFGIARAFRGKKIAQESLQRASFNRIEKSIYWTDSNGLPRKGRPDWWDDDYVYDLKISVDAEKPLPTLCYKAFANGWMEQAASNRQGLRELGLNVKGSRLVVISSTPPHHIRTWCLQVAENDLDILDLEIDTIGKEMALCHRSGEWPGSPDEWKKLTLPQDHQLADLEGAEDADSAATEVTDGEA